MCLRKHKSGYEMCLAWNWSSLLPRAELVKEQRRVFFGPYVAIGMFERMYYEEGSLTV
jgi:hypothetical protein